MQPIFPGHAEYQQQRYSEALPKLLPVAERGNADAQTMLGTMYQMGLGVEVDEEKAQSWYEKASRQGYGIATNNLAGMHLMNGETERGMQLYQLARDQGFEHTPADSIVLPQN